MPRPLIINVQSQRRPYNSGSNTELDYFTNDDNENAFVSRNEHNFPDHRRHGHGKKSKHVYHDKETPESPRKHRGHKRTEKSTITRSKSMADLKRNRRPHGQEEESSKQLQRRHSNVESNPKMFDFKETFSKFESLSNEPHNDNFEREYQIVNSPRNKGRTTVEKEASDLREVDQIKSRARLLVQEAHQINRRDKNKNYLEWQNEVIQLLKKIGEIDNRNSEAIQREKQKTLRIFKQGYSTPEVKKVERIESTVIGNGLSESKINVYDEVDPRPVNVSQLRNIYESRQSDEAPKLVTTYKEKKYYSEPYVHNKQSYEPVKPQDFDDSEYTSSSKYSGSPSSTSEEDEQVYETHEAEIHEEQPPRKRNVEESHIAKVRDLRGVFERDNHSDEELPVTKLPVASSQKYDVAAKLSDEEIPRAKTVHLPTHIRGRPPIWIKKTEEEVPQEKSSGIDKIGSADGTPKTLNDEEVHHFVKVKELKNVFEGNGPSQNTEEVHTSTMRITLEQRYIPYEEAVNERQQTLVITELNNEENDEDDSVDTSSIAKVKELKEAIENNEDNSQNTTEVNQVRYQIVSGIKHQPFIEIEKTERVVISEPTNGHITIEDAHEDASNNENEDLQYEIKEEVTVKPGEPEEESPETEEEVKHSVVVKEAELTEQEKVLISKKVLDIINEDIHLYEKEISGLDSGDEKKRMYLNEMLLRSVIQLENFETCQNEELLRERKEALLFVRECIRKLKDGVPENTEANS